MSNWWYVIIVVAVAAAAFLYLSRKRQADAARNSRTSHVSSTQDFQKDRDDARTEGMSQEDQDWQAASLQRNKEAQERAATGKPPESGPSQT